MAESTEKLDLKKDLCLYTLNAGFKIMLELSETTGIYSVLSSLILEYCAIYEPEGGCKFPYFLSFQCDLLIPEIIQSKNRIIVATSYPGFYGPHIEMTICLKMFIECRRKHSSISICDAPLVEIWFMKEYDRIWFRSRYDLSIENFPWMKKEKGFGPELSIYNEIHLYDREKNKPDLVIVDLPHRYYLANILQYAKTAKKVLILAGDDMSSLPTDEMVQFIHCNANDSITSENRPGRDIVQD